MAPNCPRCDSPNNKFCYYNNYSLTQSSSARPDFLSSVRDAATFGHGRFPSPLWPYMVLEGMVGGYSPANPGHGLTTAADDSSIDLVAMLSKFLNNHQQPAAEGSSRSCTGSANGLDR